MRKLVLLLMSFLFLRAFAVGDSVTVSGNGTLSRLNEKGAERYSYVTGLKLDLHSVDAVVYLNQKLLSGVLYGLSWNGTVIDGGLAKMDVGLKVGKLTAEGFVTYLNNPEVSSMVSAYSFAGHSFGALGAVLPAAGGSGTDQAFAASAFRGSKWAGNGAFMLNLEDLSVLSGGVFEKEFGKRQKAGVLAAFACRPYDGKHSEKWYEPFPFYHAGYAFAALFGIRYTNGKNYINVVPMVFSSPFGGADYAVRAEGRFWVGGLAGLYETFFNPCDGLFTAAGKLLDAQVSGKGSLNKTIFFKNHWWCKVGTGAYFIDKWILDEKDLKLALGVKFGGNAFSLNCGIKNQWLTGQEVWGYTVRKTLMAEKLNLTLDLDVEAWVLDTNLGLDMEHSWKAGGNVYKFSCSTGNRGKLKGNLKASVEFTEEKIKDITVGAGFSAKW